MDTISRGCFCGVVLGIVSFLGGCASETIMVDYVMPAKAVAEVNKVNVVAIKVNSRVKGNLAGDNQRNAGLVKQLLAQKLYKEGFYQVADDIWTDPEKAAGLAKVINAQNPNHGYGETFVAGGQTKAKVMIEIDLDLVLESKPVEKKVSFELTTIPYKPDANKPGEPPSSSPNPKAAKVETETRSVTVYEFAGEGMLKARFVGLNGDPVPVTYASSSRILMPKSERSAMPSQLAALAEAVSPAIADIVADISPHRETRELQAIEGGDKRVVYLLQAKAFSEVVSLVERLESAGEVEAADYENMGIAFEAMGDFTGAKFAYEKAVRSDPESASAKDGAKRVEEALSGKKAVRDSGARQNKETKFSK